MSGTIVCRSGSSECGVYGRVLGDCRAARPFTRCLASMCADVWCRCVMLMRLLTGWSCGWLRFERHAHVAVEPRSSAGGARQHRRWCTSWCTRHLSSSMLWNVKIYLYIFIYIFFCFEFFFLNCSLNCFLLLFSFVQVTLCRFSTIFFFQYCHQTSGWQCNCVSRYEMMNSINYCLHSVHHCMCRYNDGRRHHTARIDVVWRVARVAGRWNTAQLLRGPRLSVARRATTRVSQRSMWHVFYWHYVCVLVCVLGRRERRRRWAYSCANTLAQRRLCACLTLSTNSLDILYFNNLHLKFVLI